MYTTVSRKTILLLASLVLFALPALPGNTLQHVPGLATPSAYAAGCTDGSRDQAESLAAAGAFTVPQVAYVWNNSGGYWWQTKLELRYSPTLRCAWGLVNQGNSLNDVWVDRSFDGGRTWQGLLGYRRVGSGNSSTYTGVYNDAGLLMRACTNAVGGVAVCTGWY